MLAEVVWEQGFNPHSEFIPELRGSCG